MITFTPLSGAARSDHTVPLAYLLQVDDVRILLDCGSPDWCPEPIKGDTEETEGPAWEKYCDSLKECVLSFRAVAKSTFMHSSVLCRCAPSVDLVLLSHGDLAHSGLYPYAHANWGLTALAYTTLPVQAMARVAATEDVEGIRDEQDVGDNTPADGAQEADRDMSGSPIPHDPASPTSSSGSKQRKYVATVQQVVDAFDSVNVLRYSQPCHLQGASPPT